MENNISKDKAEIADIELDVMQWMNKQKYDRRAIKEIAPIVAKYHHKEASLGHAKIKESLIQEILSMYVLDGNPEIFLTKIKNLL